MAEEVRNANIVVPRVMVRALSINGILSIVAVVMFAFCLPSISSAIGSATGYPILYVMSLGITPGGIYALTAFMMAILMASNITFLVAAARMTFAFARDGGLPFSPWISKVDKKTRSPINAIILTTVITNLLSVIYVGSPTAYNAIVSGHVMISPLLHSNPSQLSVGASGQLASYALPICYLAWRRFAHPDTLPRAKWTLGRAGLPVNIVAGAYCWFVFIWSFWPTAADPTVDQFNWASVVFVGVMILAIANYFIRGNMKYTGPVALTTGI